MLYSATWEIQPIYLIRRLFDRYVDTREEARTKCSKRSKAYAADLAGGVPAGGRGLTASAPF